MARFTVGTLIDALRVAGDATTHESGILPKIAKMSSDDARAVDTITAWVTNEYGACSSTELEHTARRVARMSDLSLCRVNLMRPAEFAGWLTSSGSRETPCAAVRA